MKTSRPNNFILTRVLRGCLTRYFFVQMFFIGLLLGGLLVAAYNYRYSFAQEEVKKTSLPVVEKSPDVFNLRPYTETSIWNTPIGPSPKYDPHSPEMIATIGLSSGGRITSDTTQYSYPVYFVDESTPRWTIPCLRYKCTIVTSWGAGTLSELQNVPIPADARPSQGTDGQMILIDKNTYTEYDLYEVQRTSTGWTVSNASIYNILWDGAPSQYGSRGAGVPYYAGLVRPWEIEQGRIEHALAFGYPHVAEDRCVFPASKTDGKSSMPFAIPEGGRLQLDPSLTEADFDQMGLSRTGKIIARALQEYGMFLIDVSGRPKIYVEDLINNPFSTASWSDPELNLTDETIANIPYTHFRVLEFPAAYWNSAENSSLHGDCYTHEQPTASNPTPEAIEALTPPDGSTQNEMELTPFGRVIVEPDFELTGQGDNIDTIAFWETPDPGDTQMFVSAKNNQLVEVWQYPFVDNELPPLTFDDIEDKTQVNGVIVDQAREHLYISFSRPDSTVKVFSLPEWQPVEEFIKGEFSLKSEPGITLLNHPNGQTWSYTSADEIVYIYDMESGTQIGEFSPETGLETLVADDFYQAIYIPDENDKSGIYAYNPDGTPQERSGTNNFGGDLFEADAEGILIYTYLTDDNTDQGQGFIVVAEQKQDETDFEFFDRKSWEHLGTLNIKGVSNTDGIGSIQRALPDYPLGLFAAVNDNSSVVGVGWDKIFSAIGLPENKP